MEKIYSIVLGTCKAWQFVYHFLNVKITLILISIYIFFCRNIESKESGIGYYYHPCGRERIFHLWYRAKGFLKLKERGKEMIWRPGKYKFHSFCCLLCLLTIDLFLKRKKLKLIYLHSVISSYITSLKFNISNLYLR